MAPTLDLFFFLTSSTEAFLSEAIIPGTISYGGVFSTATFSGTIFSFAKNLEGSAIMGWQKKKGKTKGEKTKQRRGWWYSWLISCALS